MKLIKAKKYLCMLLAAMLVSTAAIGVNAEELITGIGDWLVDIGISEDSIDDYPVEDELVPQAATECGGSSIGNDCEEGNHDGELRTDREPTTRKCSCGGTRITQYFQCTKCSYQWTTSVCNRCTRTWIS